jgi:hypothetical protein
MTLGPTVFTSISDFVSTKSTEQLYKSSLAWLNQVVERFQRIAAILYIIVYLTVRYDK